MLRETISGPDYKQAGKKRGSELEHTVMMCSGHFGGLFGTPNALYVL